MNNIKAANEVRKKKIITLVVCVIAVIAIAVGVLVWSSNRKAQYNKALFELTQHNYSEAVSLLEGLNGYQDSAERLQEGHYQLGASYLASGNYENAKSEFDLAGDYSDAYTQANECVYQRATMYLNARDYDAATWDFSSISGYRDADTMAQESQYRKASSLVNAGDYDAAYEVLSNITGYRDVDSILASLPRNYYMTLGVPASVENYVDVTLQSIEFRKNIDNGEVTRCFIVADVAIQNRHSSTLDLRSEIDTTQIYALHDGGTQESGYLSLQDLDEGGFLAWHSSNDPYSSNYPESLIDRADRIAKTTLVLSPSTTEDNFHFQFDIPSYVFDEGSQVTICFQIGQNTFVYSGNIEHNEVRL